jgi:prevent-host-death family protein
MKTIDVTKAKATLGEYADSAVKDPLVLTRHGKPIAALIALTGNVDLESLSLSTNPDFIAILQRSRESLRRQGGLSSEEMRRRVEEMNRNEAIC